MFDTTGPGLVSRTLAEYPGACDQVKVLFPEDVCDPNSWHCFGTFGVHLQGGTWSKRKGFVRARLKRRLKLQIPESPLRAHFVKARVKVRQYPDGTHAIFHGPRRLGRYDEKGVLREEVVLGDERKAA